LTDIWFYYAVASAPPEQGFSASAARQLKPLLLIPFSHLSCLSFLQLKAGCRGSLATAPLSSTHPPQPLILYIYTRNPLSFSSNIKYGVHRALLESPWRRRLCPPSGARAAREPASPIGPQVPRLGQVYILTSFLSLVLCNGGNRRRFV